MTKNLRERAEETAKEVKAILGIDRSDLMEDVVKAVEHAIIKALVEERERCAEMARRSHEDDEHKAREVAEEIGKVRSVMISNLAAMR